MRAPATSIKVEYVARATAQTMMNTWTHILGISGLALMALVMHILIRNDVNVRQLDVAQFYTMVREKGDVASAKQLLVSEDNWLSSACRSQAVNKSLPTSDPCVDERRALRNKILASMNCFTYSSQVCSYLRNVTLAIIQNKTISGATYAIGKPLSGVVPNQGSLTYRQLLYNVVSSAPYLFHNSYRAAQSDNFYVLRSILYGLVVFAILGNILVHYFDQFEMTWTRRLVLRILLFSLTTLLPTCLFFINAGGSAFVVLIGIWLPALVVLLYYEAFLDASIERPWIHPYTFSIIYASTSVLALTESDVLNSAVIGIALAQAHAVSMLYMQIVWYWAGKQEKSVRKRIAAFNELGLTLELYTTKEMQYALYLAMISIAVLSLCQTVGPFDYSTGDIYLRGAPCLFALISVWGTLFLQNMVLCEEYGKEEAHTPDFGGDYKRLLVHHSTRITGGKLGVSLLLIVFGTLYEFNMLGEYFRGLRAYQDKLPDKAWQFDVANKYTIGTGFLPAPTLYL